MDRYVRHKSDEAKLDQGHTFRPEKGEKVIKFIEKNLKLESGEKFEVLPWMQDCIHSWYSWIRPDGLRSTKVGWLTCGRKNAKTFLGFGLCAYHLLADGVLSPSVISAATDRKQAAQVYDWFEFNVNHNYKLLRSLIPTKSRRIISYPAVNGVYESIASDARHAFGHGRTMVYVDELAFHLKDDLYTALKDSTTAKKNGFKLITSTAGFDKNGIFFKQGEYSRKILSGEEIDTAWQPWIFEAKTEDWDDQANWFAANPSLGVTVPLDEFRDDYNREKQEISSLFKWIRLRANRWTEAENGWIAPEKWDACKGEFPDLTGKPVVLGLDVGSSMDLTAISLVCKHEGKFYVRSWGFAPEGVFKGRDKTNYSTYMLGTKDGSLTITSGEMTDTDRIKAFFDELCSKYAVKCVVFDKYQSLEFNNHLTRKNLETLAFPQTHAMFNGPCVMLERLVSNKTIVHDGNSMLRWQIGHTYLDRDSKGHVKLTAARDENKTDNVVSLVMALSEVLNREQGRSVYEDRGILL